MNRLLVVFLLSILFIETGWAQQSNEREAIQEFISDFFVAMKEKDTLSLSAAFHPDATMHTVQEEGGDASLIIGSVAGFINRVGSTEVVLDERITDFTIQIDGAMATAWTPYRFYTDETFHHCGVNTFLLIRLSSGWKITQVTDTRRTENCSP